MEIKIFKPEFLNFSVTITFKCEYADQIGIKEVPNWINHFISLKSNTSKEQDYYSKCMAILKQAYFCEAICVSINHMNNSDGTFVKFTLYFDSLTNLNKFVDTIAESVRFS